MNGPELLTIGHVTFDLAWGDLNRREPGGAVAFASITAIRHGIKPVIVTSCADDYPMDAVIESPERFERIRSPNTSTFENRYDVRGDRCQILHASAGVVTEADVPDAWRAPDLLFVGPLTQELPYDCLDWFRPKVACVVPQGWLRAWDEPLPSEVRVSTSPP